MDTDANVDSSQARVGVKFNTWLFSYLSISPRLDTDINRSFMCPG